MVWKLDRKTFRWKFIESIEPPRVMHIEVFDEIQSENYFAQITVRLHTKQVRVRRVSRRSMRYCKPVREMLYRL